MVLIFSKNRTARLSGGMETGRTVLSWGKGLVSFQRLEKSDIPAAGVAPASMCSISGVLYLTKLQKQIDRGKKSNLSELYVPNVRLFGIILKIFRNFFCPTVFPDVFQ